MLSVNISNIAFSWAESNNLVLPLGTDNKRYISLISPNTEEKISFTVTADPNIATGIYPLDITMTFNDSNGTRTQTSRVGLIVGGATDFEISADNQASGQLSVSIANIGSNNASAVVVKIPQQQGITVTGSSIAILGNLNKGDYTIASFQVQTAGTQGFSTRDQNQGQQGFPGGQQTTQGTDAQLQKGPAGITIQIDYTDTTGERQSVQKIIQLNPSASSTGTIAQNFRNRQGNNSLSFLPWALLAIFAIGGIAFNKFKAKKAWKMLAIVIAIIAVLFLAAIFLLNADIAATTIAAIASIILLVFFFRSEISGLVSRGKKKQ